MVITIKAHTSFLVWKICFFVLPVKHCLNHCFQQHTGKPFHKWNHIPSGKRIYKANWVLCRHKLDLSPRCRPLLSLEYVEAKTERPLHSHEQTKQKCTFYLTWRRVVLVCLWTGPRSLLFTSVLSKRLGRSSFRHVSHFAAFCLLHIHIWMQVQHLQQTQKNVHDIYRFWTST